MTSSRWSWPGAGRAQALKGVDAKTLAVELGLSNASLSRAYALLTLPEDVQRLVDGGQLNESSAVRGDQAARCGGDA